MTCSSCGAPVAADDVFCGKCGTPVKTAETAATAEMTGRRCPYCRFALDEGEAITECSSCHSVHHADCWKENGGCAVASCPGGPSTTTTATQALPSPPQPVGPVPAAAPP